MTEQKPRKFRAKDEIYYEKYFYANIDKSEILTLNTFEHDNSWITFKEKVNEGGYHWRYFVRLFEEVFEDQEKPVNTDYIKSFLDIGKTIPVSIYNEPKKLTIDEIIQLKQSFTLEEIKDILKSDILQ